MVRAALAAVLAILSALPAAGQDRQQQEAWVITLDACLRYLESGERAVFDGWDVAFPGGGVCNGDPQCETDMMTFIPAGRGAQGAATVIVPEPVVGDRPAEAVCMMAPGVIFRANVIAPAHREFIAAALNSGRLAALDAEAGQFVGCAFDGRRFDLSVAVRSAGLLRFRADLRPDAPHCPGAAT